MFMSVQNNIENKGHAMIQQFKGIDFPSEERVSPVFVILTLNLDYHFCFSPLQ